MESYELGFKSQWWDRRLTLNVAAFQSNYTNLQLSVVAPGSASSIVSNAGEVRIRGLEAELAAEPVDGLTFNGSLGFIDFEYLELGPAAGVGESPCLSCTTPFVPDWQIAFGGQYVFDLGAAGTLTPRLDWSYRSKTYNDLPNSEIAATPGYSLFDARIAYETDDGDWGISLEVKNIGDKLYYPNKFSQYNGAGILVGQVGLPRTFLFSIRRDF